MEIVCVNTLISSMGNRCFPKLLWFKNITICLLSRSSLPFRGILESNQQAMRLIVILLTAARDYSTGLQFLFYKFVLQYIKIFVFQILISIKNIERHNKTSYLIPLTSLGGATLWYEEVDGTVSWLAGTVGRGNVLIVIAGISTSESELDDDL